MRRSLRSFALATVCAVLYGVSTPAPAQSTYSYQFGTLFAGDYAPPVAALPFAWLSIQTADNLHFTYDLQVGNLAGFFGSGAFVASLLVNSAQDVDPASSTIAPGTWGVSHVFLNPSPPAIGEVAWDFGDALCASAGSCFGSNMLTSYERVVWTTSFSSPQPAPHFAVPPVAIKVAGISGLYSASGISYYTPMAPIPEPGTYALMMAGLGALALRLRRRRSGDRCSPC